ncbi:MAG: GntR family transcriptional regulator [Thermotogae bacterium]|jgi:GntR family transcriptional regulator|nr:GntR family transcriptional regulator [Thermotogota bacterium]MCL5032704.1 GntR family transcriptional regulator [Thermotogota bacterium]
MKLKFLDESDPLPLYYQLKVLLKERIDLEWKAGSKIPTENELAKFYGTSLMTVRQSVGLLVNEGLLIKKQGKGTFVAPVKIQKGPHILNSFTEEMKQRGFEVKSELLRFGKITPDSDVRKILNLSDDDQVYFIQRLRYANNEPVGIQSTNLACDVEIESSELTGSLYELLETKFDIQIKYADEFYSAILIDKQMAHLLDVSLPSVGFAVKRIGYTSDGKPIEYTESIMRADKYSISVKLQK